MQLEFVDLTKTKKESNMKQYITCNGEQATNVRGNGKMVERDEKQFARMVCPRLAIFIRKTFHQYSGINIIIDNVIQTRAPPQLFRLCTLDTLKALGI